MTPTAKLRVAAVAVLLGGTSLTAAQRRFRRFRSRLHNAGSAATGYFDDPGAVLVLAGIAILDAADRPEVRAALPKQRRG